MLQNVAEALWGVVERYRTLRYITLVLHDIIERYRALTDVRNCYEKYQFCLSLIEF